MTISGAIHALLTAWRLHKLEREAEAKALRDLKQALRVTQEPRQGKRT